MTNSPSISVILPVYNTQQYIREAIDSILTQSFTDFELIIIDDCSTDESLQIIQSYRDKRIRVIENHSNLGVAETMNLGIKNASGKFIARMDSDDISLPTRLAKQYDFLEKHQEIDFVGGGIKRFGHGLSRKIYFPTHHELISCTMLLYCPFAHPTVMFRQNVFMDYGISYRANYKCEDYDLYQRLIPLVKSANIDEVLLLYRVHNKQLTALQAPKIHEDTILIRTKHIQAMGFSLSQEDIQRLANMTHLSSKRSLVELKAIFQLLVNLRTQNETRKLFSPSQFNPFLALCWLYACKYSSHLGFKALSVYFKKRRFFPGAIEFRQQLHLFLRCILKGLTT